MKNIVVLVSGGGTNLQRIIDCIESGAIQNAQISLVIADRECFGLERAKKHGISTQLIPRGKSFSSDLKNILPENSDLIVLAGFLWKFPEYIIKEYPNKIINIHPALLPNYGGKGMYGMHVHQAVLKNKDKETGITIHYVNENNDEGEFIFQQSVNIEGRRTADEITEKVHVLEHKYFPAVIEQILKT